MSRRIFASAGEGRSNNERGAYKDSSFLIFIGRRPVCNKQLVWLLHLHESLTPFSVIEIWTLIYQLWK
jgi:hypothetical protein